MKNHKINCQCCICKAKRHETFGDNNSFYGKKHSKKTKQKMSENHANIEKENNPFYGKCHTKETREKNRIAHLGKKPSAKTRKKRSITMKKIYLEGKGFQYHTEETKRKISILQGGTGIRGENSEYGKEFTNQLKEQVRFRDKYKCKLCGCSQLENGKKLDVHHIDYDKKNNNPINLISLCVKCHRKTNWNREYWRKKLNILI